MSNSPLVDYTNLSPNHSGKRTHCIDTITPHCVVGQLSVETVTNMFKPVSRQASANYVIGSDARVALNVDEENRSWCSSNRENDQRAITIECASDTTKPYAFKYIVYYKLIDLCVDICQRYNKKKLIWIADKTEALAYEPKEDEMKITVHRWFDARECPGDWLYSRLSDVANTVTNRLTENIPQVVLPSEPIAPDEILYRVQVGAYKVKQNASNQKAKLNKEGYDCFVVLVDGLYKVQVGAFRNKQNAINLQNKLKANGYSCFITTNK